MSTDQGHWPMVKGECSNYVQYVGGIRGSADHTVACEAWLIMNYIPNVVEVTSIQPLYPGLVMGLKWNSSVRQRTPRITNIHVKLNQLR